MSEVGPGGGTGGSLLRSWQAWSGFLAGAGLAFLLAAALVEQQVLIPRNKGWIGMLGALCLLGCIGMAAVGRRAARRPA